MLGIIYQEYLYDFSPKVRHADLYHTYGNKYDKTAAFLERFLGLRLDNYTVWLVIRS